MSIPQLPWSTKAMISGFLIAAVFFMFVHFHQALRQELNKCHRESPSNERILLEGAVQG